MSTQDFRRYPLWQLMLDGQPFVCTDLELGTKYNQVQHDRRICSCLGATWAARYRPEMKELFRYIRDVSEGGRIVRHTRVGFADAASNPAWAGFTKGPSLGFAFPHDHALGADDLTTALAYEPTGAGSDAGYYYRNGLEILDGHPQPLPFDAQVLPVSSGFRLHAPQVVRVGVNWASARITLDPDEVLVSSGYGAPIIWWRSASNIAADGMHWSFAELSIDENTTPPSSGQAYQPLARFCIRHMTSDEIVVIDNNTPLDGSQGQVFDYRLSVYDGYETVMSVDPKIRNGTGLGSGAPGGG